MARRHSCLQTPKDRETERLRDGQEEKARRRESEREREIEGATETVGGEKMIKIEGKREGVRERHLVITTDEGWREARLFSCHAFCICSPTVASVHTLHTQTNTQTLLPCMSMNYPWNNGSSFH